MSQRKLLIGVWQARGLRDHVDKFFTLGWKNLDETDHGSTFRILFYFTCFAVIAGGAFALERQRQWTRQGLKFERPRRIIAILEAPLEGGIGDVC